ncbi:oxidoreductase [Flexivirga meconopsidis]|uniref:oxidoreductase n=1 Tax=Flexivirga meconopsidis TaxID=2977121 RepID=UPI002240198E
MTECVAGSIASPASDAMARAAIGKRWTARSVPDLAGRRVVITGATRGLGRATALALASKGASLVLPVRSPAAGYAVAEEIRREHGVDVTVGHLDLADLPTVRSFVDELDGPVDVLINNAGRMWGPRMTTVDGFEAQLGTNYLGHFALTGLLLPTLLAGPAPRVVSLSSVFHRFGTFAFDDMHFTRGYAQNAAYARSKLATLVFARELARRATTAGVALRSYAAHPGYSATDLQTDGVEGVTRLTMRLGNALLATSAEEGAWPTVCAATLPELPNGTFVGPSKLGGYRGTPGVAASSRLSRDEAVARELWEFSERETGVRPSTLLAVRVARMRSS